LVQVGDVLDRGKFECACLALLASLSRQAREGGGGVVLVLGNHEVMNTLGLFNYADDEGNEEFERTFGGHFDAQDGGAAWRLGYAGNQPARWRALEPEGALASFECLSEFALAAKVGRSVFVHGGLTARHLADHGGVRAMNAKAKEWMTTAGYVPKMTAEDKASASPREIIACAQARADEIQRAMPEFLGGGSKDRASPVWMRDLSSPPDVVPGDPHAAQTAREALEAVAAAESGGEACRIVVGHTPQKRINSACGGTVWRIDVGMSSGVADNLPEVLQIVHGEREDEVFVIRPGEEERIRGVDRECYDPKKVDETFL